MDKNVLRSIAGIELYPLISLAIFFFFFLGLLLYVVLVNRQHIHAMSQLPLLPDPDETFPHPFNQDVLC